MQRVSLSKGVVYNNFSVQWDRKNWKRSALSRPIIYYNNTTALQIIILNKRKKNEKEQSLETAKNWKTRTFHRQNVFLLLKYGTSDMQ